jgi:hypothetical protein
MRQFVSSMSCCTQNWMQVLLDLGIRTMRKCWGFGVRDFLLKSGSQRFYILYFSESINGLGIDTYITFRSIWS